MITTFGATSIRHTEDAGRCVRYYRTDMDNLVYTLKALADPVRLSILGFLLEKRDAVPAQDGEVCACNIEDFLGLSQQTVSYHMNLLKRAGLIETEKRGRWVYYRLDPEGVGEVIQSLEKYRSPLAAPSV